MEAQMIQTITNLGTEMIQSVIPLVSFYLSNSMIYAYLIRKDYSQSTRQIMTPIELKEKYTEIEYNENISREIRNSVSEFITTVTKEFPADSLINFYNNINEVNIKRNFSILLDSSLGKYYCTANEIEYAIIHSVYHELFHMASTVADAQKQSYCSGFRQKYISSKGWKSIGVGLNEGYTELLTQRYFGNKHLTTKYCYSFEVKVARVIEKIVGEEEIRRLYLNANLKGLIDNLKQYASEEEIIDFLNKMDLISNHSRDFLILKNDKMQASIEYVYNFLLKAYITKLKVQVEDGIISTNQFTKYLAEGIKTLGTSTRIMGHTYNYLNIENALDICDEVFTESITSKNKIKRK